MREESLTGFKRGARLENITIAAKSGQTYAICFWIDNGVGSAYPGCPTGSFTANATFSGAAAAGTVSIDS